jgi:hypothetical protein
MQRIQVELAGKLADDAVRVPWSACIAAWSQVLAEVQAHG